MVSEKDLKIAKTAIFFKIKILKFISKGYRVDCIAYQ